MKPICASAALLAALAALASPGLAQTVQPGQGAAADRSLAAPLPAAETAKLFREGDPVGRKAVDAAGNNLGTIDYVLADPTNNEVTYALITGPGTNGRYIAVPVGMLREQGELVLVDVLPKDLEGAQRYARDEIEQRYPRRSVAAVAPAAARPTGTVATAAAGLGALGTAGTQGSRVGDPPLTFYRGLLGPKDYTPTGIAVLNNQGELIGKRVVDAGGQAVGSIAHTLVEPDSQKPRYAVIDTGAGSFIVAPVTSLAALDSDQVMINATNQTLAAVPRYSLRQLEQQFRSASR